MGCVEMLDGLPLVDVMRAAETDEESLRSRIAVCESLSVAFRQASTTAWTQGSIVGGDRKAGVSPFGFGTDAVVALGWIAGFGGELVSGAITLLRDNNRYGAMALVRQLVEVEYLAWAAAEDPDQAEAWIRSTREERLSTWQPGRIRDRSGGRFRQADYSDHCERGGHPSPMGRVLLRDHSAGVLGTGICWFELANHGSQAWEYLIAAKPVPHDTEQWVTKSLVACGERSGLPQAVADWKAKDLLRTVMPTIFARMQSEAR